MSSMPHRAGVAGDVIGAREDHNNFGLQVDHILAKTNQHLRRGLSADAAVDVRLARKIFVEMPQSVMESPKKTTRFSPALVA